MIVLGRSSRPNDGCLVSPTVYVNFAFLYERIFIVTVPKRKYQKGKRVGKEAEGQNIDNFNKKTSIGFFLLSMDFGEFRI